MINLRGSNTFSVSSTSNSPGLPVTTNAGDTIIVVASMASGVTLTPSGAGATWVTPVSNAGTAPGVYVMIGYGTSAGQTSFNLSSSSTGGSAVISVWNGINITSSPVVQSQTAAVSSSTSGTATLTSTTKYGNLIIAGSSHFGATTFTPTWSNSATNNHVNTATFSSRPATLDYIPTTTAQSSLGVTYTYGNSNSGGIAIVELQAGIYTSTQPEVTRIQKTLTFVKPSVFKTIGSNQEFLSYTAAGTYSWTAPQNVTSVIVDTYGAGGGGGGALGNDVGSGTGGGGGGYSRSTVTVTPGTTYTIVVGAGGTGGANTGANGNNGGDSTFASTTVVAKGGSGGYGDVGGLTSGPLGGVLGTGTVRYIGGASNTTSTSTAGSAGGSAATSFSNGVGGLSGTVTNISASGNGNGAAGGTPTNGYNGQNGTFPGGAGSGGGAKITNPFISGTGGNGADGAVYLTFYQPTATTTSKARITNTFTTPQTSKARISKSFTSTQSSVARIQKTLTSTEPSKARIQNTLTSTQPSKARISKTFTSTQLSVARISKTFTTTQTSVANIAPNIRTTTQTSKARIAKFFNSNQTSVARIIEQETVNQTSKARIVKTSSTTQSSVSRVQINGTSNQPSTARISKSFTTIQSEVTRITKTQTSTQPSVSKIQINRSYYPNLLYNGDFEIGTTWAVAGWATTTGATVSIDNSVAYTGTQSAKIVVDGSNTNVGIRTAAGYVLSVPTTTSFLFNVYVKSDTAGQMQIQFMDGSTPVSGNYLQSDGVTWNSTASYFAINTSTTWQLIQIPFTTSSSGYLHISDFKRANPPSQAGRTFWVDTVSFNNLTTPGQPSVSRISKTQTATQTSISRIQKTFTAVQTAVSRIVELRTTTQPSKARIASRLTTIQTAVSRLQKTFTITQSAVTRIAKTFTATQSEITRIQKTFTSTQPSVANVQIVPTVAASGQSSLTTSGTTLTVTYPTYSANQTVVINISSTQPITVPTGWTLIGSRGSYLYAIYKIMNGSEGSTLSITLTTAGTARTTQYTINAGPTPYKVLTAGAVSANFTTLVIPPAITFSGSNNYLVFNALNMTNGTTISVTSYPSNMQGNQLSTASSSTVPGVASSSATVFGVSSFTPTAYSLSFIVSGVEMTYGLYFAYEASNQPSKARIKNTLTALQTAIARIVELRTTTQTSKGAIQNKQSITQTSIAKIAPIKGTVINVPVTQQSPIALPVTQQSPIALPVTDLRYISIPVTQQGTITLPTTVQTSVTTSVTQNPVLTIPVVASTPITISIIVSFP